MSSPLVMPPSRPPARLEARGNFFGRFVVENFVLHFAAERTGSENARADLDGLHRLHAHDGLRELAIQLFVPLRVRAKADRYVARDDFEIRRRQCHLP